MPRRTLTSKLSKACSDLLPKEGRQSKLQETIKQRIWRSGGVYSNQLSPDENPTSTTVSRLNQHTNFVCDTSFFCNLPPKFQQFLKRTHCLQRSYQTDKPQQVIKWADVCNTLVSQGIITREDGGKEGGSSFSTDFHERLEALSELDEEQLEAVEDYLEQSARNVISQMDQEADEDQDDDVVDSPWVGIPQLSHDTAYGSNVGLVVSQECDQGQDVEDVNDRETYVGEGNLIYGYWRLVPYG
eukprot:TRINITY_DN27413_c0_g4_i2.p2 TRINITY_DN27413_c0_g4~~TRINITY_DN27413_c0_g4_i2.p2  ORF type:complete len:242 (+),score=18.83 TRINITY_DN27413_c0_g4_i2:90-815(+)